jgi:uncharacterized repeat protein (TIGR03803 family)
MNKVLRFRVAASAVFLLCVVTSIAAPAQTFTTLASFDGTNGAEPEVGSLVQGLDGNFYGTTYDGGAHGTGVVFKVTPGGKLTILYSFCSQTNCADGGNPYGGLVLATDGNFYGTTSVGGAVSYAGTFFRVTPTGTLTTLYSFCAQQPNCADGEQPFAGLVEATDGDFYGTTHSGGAHGYGTVFKITPTGTLTTLYSFCTQANCADGSSPSAGLVQATDGKFYGTTYEGGADNACYGGCGTVFKVASEGTLTTLHSFDETDGAGPLAGLVQAIDRSFYGTTYEGGNLSCFAPIGCGTIFKISSGGTLTTLHSFDSTDGGFPFAGLVQAADGNFYGTTELGGANDNCADGCGTVFAITSEGTLTTLHSFDGTDGYELLAGLVQGTEGNFYGTAHYGGSSNDGTLFSLSVGPGPFVETLPTAGKVGSKVIILGNGLTGTTGVTFNGTPATFTVASPTEIKATVPTGATSGNVQVTTPHGTLTSNVVFRVGP